jgi:exocyst complex component 8
MSVWSMGGGGGDRMSMGDVPPLPEWAADARGMGGLNSFLTLGGLGGGLGAKDKAEGDARWISEFSDGLTVAIALREWEEAVGLVEEGKWRLSCFSEISGCWNGSDADGFV